MPPVRTHSRLLKNSLKGRNFKEFQGISLRMTGEQILSAGEFFHALLVYRIQKLFLLSDFPRVLSLIFSPGSTVRLTFLLYRYSLSLSALNVEMMNPLYQLFGGRIRARPRKNPFKIIVAANGYLFATGLRNEITTGHKTRNGFV